jgi:hypothetical protein
VAPRAHTVLAFVRPRFGTAAVAWDLAIVDPLLVARLDAKSLLGSAGRLIVALIGIVVVAALDRRLLRARHKSWLSKFYIRSHVRAIDAICSGVLSTDRRGFQRQRCACALSRTRLLWSVLHELSDHGQRLQEQRRLREQFFTGEHLLGWIALATLRLANAS